MPASGPVAAAPRAPFAASLSLGELQGLANIKVGQPIHVQLTASERELRLCVNDNGLGISAENKNRIFERFERLITGHSSPGFGLGLSIVAAITTTHHGTLDLHARPHGGLRVTVTLPLAARPALTAAAAS